MENARGGFTFIELLVVIAISAVISAAAIGYSRVGKNLVALSVEQSKMVGIILEARQLSIATYSAPTQAQTPDTYACGYGVHFDFSDPENPTYSIFAYTAASSSKAGTLRCPPAADVQAAGLVAADMHKYTDSTWKIPLQSGVSVTGPTDLGAPGDVLTDVLFYPPDPTTLIKTKATFTTQRFDSPQEPADIYLHTIDGVNSATINVGVEGQVTFSRA